MNPLSAHVFICTNERPAGHERGCCKNKDSENLLKEFKKCLLEKKLNHTIRAQKAGCLDVCEKGAALVIYPENVWYGGVKLSDVSEIVEKHLVQGQKVTRLLIPEKMG